MKISFHGAAQMVTGSKHLITLNNGVKILLDCGMFQGNPRESDALNRDFGFEPAEIDYLILSHAHIDHCGLIPRLPKLDIPITADVKLGITLPVKSEWERNIDSSAHGIIG